MIPPRRLKELRALLEESPKVDGTVSEYVYHRDLNYLLNHIDNLTSEISVRDVGIMALKVKCDDTKEKLIKLRTEVSTMLKGSFDETT